MPRYQKCNATDRGSFSGRVSEKATATSPRRFLSRGTAPSSEHILRRIPAFSFLEMSNGLSMVEFLSDDCSLFSMD